MTTITVTIWHNVALDAQGHHTGMLEGYQPGDPVVRVFTYQRRVAAGDVAFIVASCGRVMGQRRYVA